jgi:hypothetical protein
MEAFMEDVNLLVKNAIAYCETCHLDKQQRLLSKVREASGLIARGECLLSFGGTDRFRRRPTISLIKSIR